MSPGKLVFRTHAIRRMLERGISIEDVRHVLYTGEVIEDYPKDFPYPSRLMLGWSGTRPIHVVAAYNAIDSETIVITVYEPDPAQWDADFRRRL
ncbi:MAG TPA: DUF4258 domain-containing protein [Chloroflexia bacterium]|nr:DUF4258 domain-containing protein [Chloroflexia bacterium]